MCKFFRLFQIYIINNGDKRLLSHGFIRGFWRTTEKQDSNSSRIAAGRVCHRSSRRSSSRYEECALLKAEDGEIG